MSVDEVYRIGTDLGGTKTEVILLSPAGEEVFRKRTPTPAREGYSAILNNIVTLISEARQNLPESSTDHRLGIGIPGIIDSTTGLVINANTTVLIGNPLGSDLEQRLGAPIAVENDANCFVMAEASLGAARGYDMVFGIIMGTGCGGGIVWKNQIRKGPHGIAGEWGHFSIDPDGIDCYCGNRGCVETLISGSGVERHYFAKFNEKKIMEDIVREARNGVASSLSIFNEFIESYGRAVGGIISTMDPDVIVLGGGLSNIDELYTIGLESIHRYAFHKNLKTPVLKNQLGDSAGVIGAAYAGI